MILRKYNIILVGCSLLLLLAIITSLLIWGFSTPQQAYNANVAKEAQLPCIIIDAGHGGEDGGAVAEDGTVEKDINLKIAKYLHDFLVSSGYPVKMIRDEDVSIHDDGCETIKERKVSDMKNRLAIYNESENNVVIGIHQNKFEQTQYYGTQVFYSPNNKESSLLADSMQKAVVGMLQSENTRETKSGNKSIYLLWNSTSPTVLIECGFLSNAEELGKLKTETYQKEMAFTIYCGFLDYINQNNGSDEDGI